MYRDLLHSSLMYYYACTFCIILLYNFVIVALCLYKLSSSVCVLPFLIINLLNTIIILAKRGWTNYALVTKQEM